jgi:hypothetical protein
LREDGLGGCDEGGEGFEVGGGWRSHRGVRGTECGLCFVVYAGV